MTKLSKHLYRSYAVSTDPGLDHPAGYSPKDLTPCLHYGRYVPRSLDKAHRLTPRQKLLIYLQSVLCLYRPPASAINSQTEYHNMHDWRNLEKPIKSKEISHYRKRAKVFPYFFPLAKVFTYPQMTNNGMFLNKTACFGPNL